MGRTPEARVRWVLDFVSRDPARLSPREQKVAWDALWALQAPQGVRGFFPSSPGKPRRRIAPAPHAVEPAVLDKTHRVLEDCIRFLANGKPAYVRVPEVAWHFYPPPRRPTGARHSAPVRRLSSEYVVDTRFTPALAVFAFVDDLNAIDADRLRACPLESEGKRCGVVFLGTRGQRYCTPRHARAAAWQAYIDRAGAARKLRRKG